MTASGKASAQGNEAFYIDEHGQKADADIHHDILDAVDDQKFRQQSFMRAVKAGIPPERAAKMYGLEGGYDLADLSNAQATEGVVLTLVPDILR